MLYGRQAGVASFNTPKAVGEYLGRVDSTTKGSFSLHTPHRLSAGDGICVINRNEVRGTNINKVEGDIVSPNRMEGIVAGVELFRNYDHQFTLALESARIRRTIEANATLQLSSEGITLTVCDEQNEMVEIGREIALTQAANPEKMQQTARRTIAKSGGTIFDICEVEVKGDEWFAPAGILSEMRREALERLHKQRAQRKFAQKILTDNPSVQYPREVVSRYENVTNHLSREFYLEHGAKDIEPALEASSTRGERVMVSSYCLRREIGQCLKEQPSLKGELYLEHGTARYRLDFDCKRCLMMLYDHSKL